MADERKQRKTITGSIVSSSMDKTVVVKVERLAKHPRYGKYIKKRVKYSAHDETNQCGTGDKVSIVATRPLSKTKRWRVKEVLEKAK
ncbi:MAG: 30S ribosomal protein S17 [Proteobacteria bacterium]|nr:30S ribosomal protein S17 [Pseudomonadota bacterium]